MKIYIILALVAITSTSAAEWQLKTMEEWSQIHKTCDDRYKVSEELIEKARVDKYPPKEVFEVVLCILRSVEVWNDSEGFSTDRLMIGLESVATKENVNKQYLRESLEKCKDSNSEKSPPLDWAYRWWFNCFKDNEPLYEALRKVNFVRQDKSVEKV